MITETQKQIIQDIRTGKIDLNNQELFFSALIKGLILKLSEELKIRNISIPHFIVHTGSDALYLENKGNNIAIEPFEVSNENYLYTIVPRCVVNPGTIDLITDQLTNPYSNGQLQYDTGEEIMTLNAEFRRMPIKLTVELKYFTDSFRDQLELIQQIITKLAFIKTYNITYMGQSIICTYKLPDNLSDEHLTELDGTTQENKPHTMSISIEVESNIPIYSTATIASATSYVSKISKNIKLNNQLQ